MLQLVSSLFNCPLIEDHPYDFYLYQLPIFSLLVVNTVFLVVIMKAVVSQLQSSRAGEVERLHYKSARALVIVIPLLGFTYILTMVGPSYSLHPLAHQIFQTCRVCLLSTQVVFSPLIGREQRAFALIGWILITVLLRQLFYAIKNAGNDLL